MAIVITGNVTAVNIDHDPESDVIDAAFGTVQIDVSAQQDGSQLITVQAAAADIAALTVPGSCTLTFSQP